MSLVFLTAILVASIYVVAKEVEIYSRAAKTKDADANSRRLLGLGARRGFLFLFRAALCDE